MYADRVEAVTRKSIKERINGNDDDDSRRRRQIYGKRHREEDDKWVHDLYEPHEFQGSNQRVATKDLRLKLQRRRSIQQAAQLIKGSLSGGTRDLREKLSGTVYSQTEKTDAPRKKLKAIPEVSQPTKSSVIAETTASDTKYVAGKVSKKKSQQKGAVFLWKGPSTFNHEIRGSSYQRKQNRIGPLLAPFSESAWGGADSVDRFLQSLGLEKYAITFEAEEVDMAALVHMTDEDLKAMGIPMGPRKKILLALESKV